VFFFFFFYLFIYLFLILSEVIPQPFQLAFTIFSANTVSIAFTLLVYVPIAGTLEQEFLSGNFHSRCV